MKFGLNPSTRKANKVLINSLTVGLTSGASNDHMNSVISWGHRKHKKSGVTIKVEKHVDEEEQKLDRCYRNDVL